MPPILWTLNQVTLRGRQRPRLDAVSCEIHSGITAVAGDSGAGKSSLLNLLVGFERPDTGTFTGHFTSAENQLPVFWIPPGNGLWSHLPVRRHLEIVQPAAPSQPAMIDQLLQDFDLRPLEGALPDDLSQGEQARLAMTRALASRAAVLVLDEPLVHTSLLRQPAYWRATTTFCTQHSISLVIASHDLETLGREADHILILDAGRLAYSGPPESPPRPLANTIAADMLRRICHPREQLTNFEPAFKQNTGLG